MRCYVPPKRRSQLCLQCIKLSLTLLSIALKVSQLSQLLECLGTHLTVGEVAGLQRIHQSLVVVRTDADLSATLRGRALGGEPGGVSEKRPLTRE